MSTWKGVVPEVAARCHQQGFVDLYKNLLRHSSVSMDQIDAIACTVSPGLMGPLLMGLSFAKNLSLYHELPLIPVHHLAAHLEVIHLTEKIPYPYLGLIVSGGHTLLVKVFGPHQFLPLAKTRDDAAGEAFDKGARLLGLAYPGGPEIDKLAKNGRPDFLKFPQTVFSDSLDWSFSGLKSSLKQQIGKMSSREIQLNLPHICASYQTAIVESLWTHVAKCLQRKENTKLPFVVGGGVACNRFLRKRFLEGHAQTYFVPPKYCTDNAVMIACLGAKTFYNRSLFPQSLLIHAVSQSPLPSESENGATDNA